MYGGAGVHGRVRVRMLGALGRLGAAVTRMVGVWWRRRPQLRPYICSYGISGV
jgi:hypothetical protein